MNKLIVDISMSLDGLIAGPNAAPENPLGDSGLRLHDWYFKNPDDNHEFARALKSNTGAIIMGRRMYDESLPWWQGSGPLGDIPCFVLTKKGSEPQEAAEMFTFVTEGIEKALELAKAAAGAKEVLINGGANTIQRYLKAGLVDVINIHLVPMLLGSGTSLFGELRKSIELEKVSVKDEPDATHLTYRVKK
jgi:dihydrofolate reductase